MTCEVGSPTGDVVLSSPEPAAASGLWKRLQGERERSWSDLGPQTSFGLAQTPIRCRSERPTPPSTGGNDRSPQSRDRMDSQVSFGDDDASYLAGKPRLHESSVQTSSPRQVGQWDSNTHSCDEAPPGQHFDVAPGTLPPQQADCVSSGTSLREGRSGHDTSSLCASSIWVSPEDVPDVRPPLISTATSPLHSESSQPTDLALHEIQPRWIRTIPAGTSPPRSEHDVSDSGDSSSASSCASEGQPVPRQIFRGAPAKSLSPRASSTGFSLHLPQKTPTAASRLRAAFGTDTPLSAPTTTTHQAFVASGASAGLSVGRASTPKGKVVHRSPGMHRLQRASTAPPPSNTTPVSGELTEAQAELAFMLGDAFGSAKLALDCLCAAQDSQGGLSDASFQHLVAAERLNEERAADRDVGKSGEQPGIASR